MITSDELQSALVVYKNLLITANEEIAAFTKSHLDRTTLSKVMNAVLEDMTYDGKRFKNIKAQRLYQAAFAILKAKNVIRQDMLNKIESGETTLTDAQKEEALKGLK